MGCGGFAPPPPLLLLLLQLLATVTVAPPLRSQIRDAVPGVALAGLGRAAGDLAPRFAPPAFQTGMDIAAADGGSARAEAHGGTAHDDGDAWTPPLWSEAELIAAGRPLAVVNQQRQRSDPREQFLVFESWGAGFNNERMSLEMAYTLALVWCRTLVLPPLVGDRTRTTKQFRYEAFFDIPSLKRGIEHATSGRATLLTAEEFVAQVDAAPAVFGLPPTRSEHRHSSAVKLRPRQMGRGRRQGERSSYFEGLEQPEGFSLRVLDGFDLHASVIVAEPPLPLRRYLRQEMTAAETTAQAHWPSEAEFATSVRPVSVTVSATTLEDQVVVNIGSERLLGNYYSTIYIPERRIAAAAHATLRRYLTLHPTLYEAAEQAEAAVQEVMLARSMDLSGSREGGVAELEAARRDLRWAAIHNRQGDFELLYPQHWLDASDLAQVRDLIQRHGDLLEGCRTGIYYATTYAGMLDRQSEQVQKNAVESFLHPALRSAMSSSAGTIVMWRDIVGRVSPPRLGDGRDPDGTQWIGIVEMLLCARANVGFVGSYASTFTAYIHRLRGGGGSLGAAGPRVSLAEADDAEFRYTRHEPGTAPSRSGRVHAPRVSWASVNSPSAIVWSREWGEGLGKYPG